MRKPCPLQYHAVRFLLAYIFLVTLISLTLGSIDTVSEAKCEYEDANLIWRNTPAYSSSDVKAMAWYKGKGSLIATWLEGKGFVEYPPYIGRLMQIGETGIKIKTANRSDNGTYWLSLTLASVDHKLEAVTHLEIKVAPSSLCKPRITREGSILKADLPSEGCGTPHLTPKWKHTNTTVNKKSQSSSSLLDLGAVPKPGEYIVCAEGESAKCYQKNITDLCTTQTIPLHEPRDDVLTSDRVSIILPSVLVSVLAISIGVVIWLNRTLIKKHCCGNSTDSRQREGIFPMGELQPMDIDKEAKCPLLEKRKTASTGLHEIQNHLQRMYKNMTRVSVSPDGKGNLVDVSEVYIDLDFQQMETRDIKDTLVSAEDIQSVKAPNKQFSPIVILGDSGSGKSTWCKHLVQCWSQNSKIEDANVQGLNLPDLGKFKILLYLPLKSSDRGLSFEEILGQSLFQQQPAYLDIIMMRMHDKNHDQSILIVIDGLDKICENDKSVSKFLDHKLLSSCTVIFTSRPSSLKLIFDARGDSSIQLSKVSEMTLEKANAYINNVVIVINRQNEQNLHIDNFLSFTKYIHVQCLLKLPYLCLIVLFVWMKSESFFTEISDVLLDVVENILRRAMMDQSCKGNIMKVLQENSCDIPTSVNKLNKRPFLMKHVYILSAHSMIAEKIFEIKSLADEERSPETSTRPKDMLPLEVMYEIGLVTEFISLNYKENLSKLAFTNELIYEFFVSMAIAFKKGHAFDHIVSDKEVALKNSRIIHILWQLSPTVGKDIFVAIGNLRGKESESRDGNNDTSKLNKVYRYSIEYKSYPLRRIKQVMWMQSLMYNDQVDNEKLLFLTNALRSTDSLTSLVLENHGNNKEIVFWLPLSETLKTLTLSISNCTLHLCQEWNDQIPSNLEEMVMKSVNINTSTLGVLSYALSRCKRLRILEIAPEVVRTDDRELLTAKSSIGKYWIELSKCIQRIRKLQTLKLSNLSLFGLLDNLLSRIKHCTNLETLELRALSGTLDENISESYSTGLHSGTDDNDDGKSLNKIQLAHIELEQLKLQHSPFDFLFDGQNKTDKVRVIKKDLKVLRLSEVKMPDDDWNTLGEQISVLNPSELQLQNIDPRSSMPMFLNGICKCKGLMTLSVDNMDCINIAQYCSALKTLNKLSKLKLERMEIEANYLLILFKEISECKELNTLCLCNITIDKLPEELCSQHNVKNLSKLKLDNVTITGESLRNFLVGSGWCDFLV